MVFWGVEVQPGKPFTHSVEDNGDYDGSRLHLSQATLGMDGKGSARTVVKCKVGDGPELLLCSLTPGVSESCSLDLLFDQDVVFSVTGSASVHLVGYYMPLNDGCDHEDDDDEDDEDYSFGEDSEDDDSDEGDDDYELGDDSDLDIQGTSTVIIEEIIDEEIVPTRVLAVKGKDESPPEEGGKATIPVKEGGKSAKKRKGTEDSAAMLKTNGPAVKATEPVVEDGSEDEDGFPVTPKKKQALPGSDGKPITTSSPKSSKKERKKLKAKAAAEAKKLEMSAEKTPDKVPGQATVEKTPAKAPSDNGPVATPKTGEQAKKDKKSTPRKYPNGLEVEELVMGKPNGQVAKAGKKVSVLYTGKLKSNGKIFDSNIGKKPFLFRLGVGEVIKGWDVGVGGMRVGDKRRITVPPMMAYGPKGVPGTIPGNAWLVFDVELVDAAK